MENKKTDKTILIIPAYEPETTLIDYCSQLIEAGFDRLLVINDGSSKDYSPVFDTLEKMPACTILRHAVNLGKGRALKDAFNYFLNMPDCGDYCGVITVDSDGQHTVPDVLKLQKELASGREALILGVRDFTSPNVPFKSRYGNRLTRFLFRLLHGIRLHDTQTGLRAIPAGLVSTYLDIAGERFEYETNMLLVSSNKQIPFYEIKIDTVYLNENKGTHFHPVRDSIAIYKLLLSAFLKYTLASFSSFLLDIAMFQLILTLSGSLGEAVRIYLATAAARILSSIYNFLVNKHVVFQKKERSIRTVIKYYLLAAIQMCCSAGLVLLLYRLLHIPETAAKIVVDTILFFISFRIQKQFIFHSK